MLNPTKTEPVVLTLNQKHQVICMFRIAEDGDIALNDLVDNEELKNKLDYFITYVQDLRLSITNNGDLRYLYMASQVDHVQLIEHFITLIKNNLSNESKEIRILGIIDNNDIRYTFQILHHRQAEPESIVGVFDTSGMQIRAIEIPANNTNKQYRFQYIVELSSDNHRMQWRLGFYYKTALSGFTDFLNHVAKFYDRTTKHLVSKQQKSLIKLGRPMSEIAKLTPKHFAQSKLDFYNVFEKSLSFKTNEDLSGEVLSMNHIVVEIRLDIESVQNSASEVTVGADIAFMKTNQKSGDTMFDCFWSTDNGGLEVPEHTVSMDVSLDTPLPAREFDIIKRLSEGK